MTATETTVKTPGPNLWLSIGIFLVGAVLASLGIVMLGGSVLGAVTEDAFAIPGGEEREFEAGEFDVFVSAGDIFSPLADADAGPGDVTITNVDTGENVTVSPTNLAAQIGRGQTNFVAVGNFEIVEPGTYQIAVVSEVGGLAFASRAIPNSFAEVQNQVVMMAAGLVLALLGAIMIVVGMLRRSKVKRAAQTQIQRQQGTVPGQFQQPPPQQGAPPATPPQQGAPPVAPPVAPPPAPPSEPPTSGPADTATPWDN